MVFTLWDVDAVLFKGTTFDIDCFIIQNIHDEYKFSDVHLQDVLHLEEGPRLDFTVDANIILRPNNDFTVDGLISEEDKETNFSVDANAQIMPSNNYSVDAFLQLETDFDFGVDGIVVNRASLFFTLDQINSSRLPSEFTIDPITIGSIDLDTLYDSYVQEQNKLTTFDLDSSADRRSVPLVDAFIRALDQDSDFSVDAIPYFLQNQEFSIDGNVFKDGFKPFNVDAYVQALNQEFDFGVDAQIVIAEGDIDVCTVHFCIPPTPALFFTVDAITPNTFEFDFNLDSHIEAQGFFDTFDVDAFLEKRFDLVYTVDASLIKPSQTNACPSQIRDTLNCISIVRRRGA